MAESLSHKWGQVIGDILEESIRHRMERVAKDNELYLDFKKQRAARPGKKVSWQDRYGNTHDLDYVLERGGTESARGKPAAFIETAWRRYTKHSRNKVQEIEGAIVPLADTYGHFHPFLGVFLAGVFTQSSLRQLKSRGFSVLFIPYESVVRAFAKVRVNAEYDEKTPEREFRKKIEKWESLSRAQIDTVAGELLALHETDVRAFFASLSRSLRRKVQAVTVSVLHGSPRAVPSVVRAIAYIESHRIASLNSLQVSRLEIDIRYTNGDVIHASFQNKVEAIQFLRTFA
ncbi:MAG: DNA methylase N-4/N-6 domain-containing protein [Elusimicrobia bacterium]|nr:MAG: DNA methylase N-4/N-6 domain-containing protein [Elusimicrobiota bacterium]